RRRIVQAHPVVVPDEGRAAAAARPVAAGAILGTGEGRPVRLRTGEDVVAIGGVAPTVDHLALLRQGRLLADRVGPMQLLQVLGDDLALRVLPRSLADAITRIDRRRTACGARAEIGAPGPLARTGGGRERGTVPIRTLQAAEVGSLAGAGAGDEEAHLRGLRGSRGADAQAERDQQRRRACLAATGAVDP